MYNLKCSPATIIFYYGIKMDSEAGPTSCNNLPTSPVTLELISLLTARPLRMQNLCTCLNGRFTSRTCAHSITLFRFGAFLLLFVKHLACLDKEVPNKQTILRHATPFRDRRSVCDGKKRVCWLQHRDKTATTVKHNCFTARFYL
jgi:hypothetical protein